MLDVFSRRVVGWAMNVLLETTLVLDALNMALWNRRPAAGVVHHSDRGVQYTSLAYGRRCQEAGVVPSMGSAGDAYDNAIAEAFFATLETELLMRHRFIDRGTARRALFDYIEGWYNPHRRHSALGYLSRRSSNGCGSTDTVPVQCAQEALRRSSSLAAQCDDRVAINRMPGGGAERCQPAPEAATRPIWGRSGRR